mmetsp:Transcript_54481/g.117953  ORF Transcript_54481/g.117953 Transcript_54481/m.117953 type:complete len:361 (-) Transcript_54481:311-1393(-)
MLLLCREARPRRSRLATVARRAARDLGFHIIDLADPGTHPFIRDDDVALDDLAASGISFGQPKRISIPHVDGPSNGAVSRIVAVIVVWPVLITRQNCLHNAFVTNSVKCHVPCLDALLYIRSPPLRDARVDIETQMAVWSSLQVVALDDLNLFAEGLLGPLMAPQLLPTNVVIVSRKVADAVVRKPGRHRLSRKFEEGEAHLYRHAGAEMIRHRDQEVSLVGLHRLHAVIVDLSCCFAPAIHAEALLQQKLRAHEHGFILGPRGWQLEAGDPTTPRVYAQGLLELLIGAPQKELRLDDVDVAPVLRVLEEQHRICGALDRLMQIGHLPHAILIGAPRPRGRDKEVGLILALHAHDIREVE